MGVCPPPPCQVTQFRLFLCKFLSVELTVRGTARFLGVTSSIPTGAFQQTDPVVLFCTRIFIRSLEAHTHTPTKLQHFAAKTMER